MANSTQITRKVLAQADPKAAEYNIWKRTRYFIAQEVAWDGDTTTMSGYYHGHTVVPGPKAHRLAGVVANNDYHTFRNVYYIRFIDNATTDGADDMVRRAVYRPMTNQEADDYEAKVYLPMEEGRKVDPIKEDKPGSEADVDIETLLQGS